jgi:hypothetical protein
MAKAAFLCAVAFLLALAANGATVATNPAARLPQQFSSYLVTPAAKSNYTGPFIQGSATDGTNLYIATSADLSKCARDYWTGSTLVYNPTPFRGLQGYNHLGDPAYFDGKLYCPMEYYYQGASSNASIGIFKASDLTRQSVTLVSNILSEVSSVCVVPKQHTLFVSDYLAHRIVALDLSTLALKYEVPLKANLSMIQGIEWFHNRLYASADSPGTLYCIDPVTGDVDLALLYRCGANENEGLMVVSNYLVANFAFTNGTSTNFYFSAQPSPRIK